QVGDSWLAMIYTNNTGNLDSLVVSVVEIGTLDINNVTFRYVDLQSNSCGNYGYGGRFVERFGFYGSTNFSGLSNFPYVSDCSSIVETFGVGLFCFNDASFHLNGMEGRECEYPYMNFLASSEIDKEVFAVFPNPASEQVHIVCPNIIHKELAIFDILGQLVAKVTMTSNQFNLVLSGFESGIYFLKLEDSHYIQELVIE
ncbi:MAG: T9SS type A sorting domain-containing protein, partial [Putridiphycobacter sp.]|nr:T9SS type A sorting domain-containing protein [Putridiphycobacter sp.]